MGFLNDPYSGLVIIGLALAVPFLILATTSFLKLAVVMFIVRNALGVQQAPPNMALYAIAIVLTLFIMTPVGDRMLEAGRNADTEYIAQDLDGLLDVGAKVLAPLESFMERNTDPETKAALVARSKVLWPQDYLEDVDPEEHFLVLVPSFMLSELTVAFEIGLLLYLPFIVIDLVVANVLTALGMMMVSPVTIAMPFKLLLFVTINGWYRLVDGLVLSYA